MTRHVTPILIAACFAGVLFLAGCNCCRVQPKPGDAAVVLDVKAKPKAGVKAEHFARGPVYDAAPRPAKATGEYEHVDYNELGDIVVWLEPASDGASAAPRTSSTAPTSSTPPHVVDVDPAHPYKTIHAVSVGQRVALRNHSDRTVAFYSVSDGNDFELPPLKPGDSAEVEARSEGLIEVLSDPSQPPVALIYAAPSQYVARAQSGKKVVFNDVAPGSYQAIAWHPRIPGATTQLGQVMAGETRRATLQLGVNDLPKVE
jgi:hypothetical protein